MTAAGTGPAAVPTREVKDVGLLDQIIAEIPDSEPVKKLENLCKQMRNDGSGWDNLGRGMPRHGPSGRGVLIRRYISRSADGDHLRWIVLRRDAEKLFIEMWYQRIPLNYNAPFVAETLGQFDIAEVDAETVILEFAAAVKVRQ